MLQAGTVCMHARTVRGWETRSRVCVWQPKQARQADWSRSVWCVCRRPAGSDCLHLHNITYIKVRTKCMHARMCLMQDCGSKSVRADGRTGRAVLCFHGCETSSCLARVRNACWPGFLTFVSGSRRFCARRPFLVFVSSRVVRPESKKHLPLFGMRLSQLPMGHRW